MPLVINALGGRHSDRQTHHAGKQTNAISRNQARAGRTPGLKNLITV